MPSPPPLPAAADDHLDGWKDIANYLKRSVRTVQRWEAERGLPVCRIAGSDIVFGRKSEVEAWRSKRATEAEAVSRARTEAGQAAACDTQPREPEPPPAPAAPERLVPYRAFALLPLLLALLALVFLAAVGDGPPGTGPVFEPISLTWQAALGPAPFGPAPFGPGISAATAGDNADAPVRAGMGLGAVRLAPGSAEFVCETPAEGSSRSLVTASFGSPALAPRLRLTFLPGSRCRLDHAVGFLASGATLAERPGQPGVLQPSDGVAFRVHRSNGAHSDSTLSIVAYASGVQQTLAVRHLPFQLQRQGAYPVEFSLEGRQVSVKLAGEDGSELVTAMLPASLGSIDRLFAVQEEDGEHADSPGRARAVPSPLRLDEISVDDTVYRVRLRTRGPGAERGVSGFSLAILSDDAVDAASISIPSLRLNGLPLVKLAPATGTACRHEDANLDGLLDVVCRIEPPALATQTQPPALTLEGVTEFGRPVRGRTR